ncbi:MAG: helix-turn-helix transcriptional regulator [Candidatus Eremiobacteraeota bacterium]|nr:helix-turn-helix transcriptional regulator [Candidatus Eremiobacteraeota bacterium]
MSALASATRVAAILRGEPGIGKSRLLSEARARESGGAYFVACLKVASGLAHEPLKTLTRVLHHAGRISGDACASVLHCPEVDRLWQLHDAFALAAAQGPLICQMDDLHAADAATLDALHYCIGRLSDLPIRWQLTARPGYAALEAFVLALERAGLLSVIDVDGLQPEGLDELARTLRPDLAADDIAAFELHRLTAGNPLYAELLLTTRRDTRDGLPGELRAALAQRLTTISPLAMETASWLAVAHTTLPRVSLARLACLSARQLQSAFEELSDSGITAGNDESVYFRHDLLRGVCYGLLSEEERVRRHDALARLSDQPWQRAMHLEGARAYDEAAELLNAIGWENLDHHAPATALNAFDRVLQQMPKDSVLAVEALGGRATALCRLREARLAATAIADFEPHARDLPAVTRLRVLRCYAEAAWDESDDAGHVEPIALRALAEARIAARPSVPALLCVLGSIRERNDALADARELLREGLARCDGEAQPAEHIRLSSWLGVVEARQGNVAAGIRLLEDAAALARTSGRPNDFAQCCTKLCYVHHLAGDWESYRRWCEAGLAIEGSTSKTTDALLRSNAASVALDRGELRAALGFALTAEPYVADGNLVLRCRVLTHQAQIYAMLGDFEMARHALEKCARLTLAQSSRRLVDFSAGFVAELHDDLRAAEKHYAAAANRSTHAIGEAYEVRALAGLVRVGSALHDAKLAGGALKRLTRVAQHGWALAALSLREAQGCFALMSGDPAAAAADLITASRGQYPYWRARLTLLAAAALKDRALFSEAIELFDSMGATHASDQARALARAHGFRPGRKREAHGALSAREMSVAFFVANGKTNAEIGELLHVSARTVEYHIGNILSKCGLRSRVEIAARIAAGQSLCTAV